MLEMRMRTSIYWMLLHASSEAPGFIIFGHCFEACGNRKRVWERAWDVLVGGFICLCDKVLICKVQGHFC
jgi:hypothetical protein